MPAVTAAAEAAVSTHTMMRVSSKAAGMVGGAPLSPPPKHALLHTGADAYDTGDGVSMRPDGMAALENDVGAITIGEADEDAFAAADAQEGVGQEHGVEEDWRGARGAALRGALLRAVA